MSTRYRCHQCFGVIDFDHIAHLDLYANLCWIQCDVCEVAFGPCCGMDRHANPHPHGYLECPLVVPILVSTPRRCPRVVLCARVKAEDLELVDPAERNI